MGKPAHRLTCETHVVNQEEHGDYLSRKPPGWWRAYIPELNFTYITVGHSGIAITRHLIGGYHRHRDTWCLGPCPRDER